MYYFPPFTRLMALVALYLAVCALTVSRSGECWGAIPAYLLAAIMWLGPGSWLLYACALIWRTRNDPSWTRYSWLPLRGRWLCTLVVGILTPPSVLILLSGLLAMVLICLPRS